MTAKLAASRRGTDLSGVFERPDRAPCESDHFRSLMQAKKLVIGALLVVTLGYFIGMTLLAGYAKPFMAIKLVGSFTVGYGMVLATYVICWAGALIYVRVANGMFDEKTRRAIEAQRARRA